MNSPRLLMAVGRAILEWASIDHEITSMCGPVWHEAYPNDRIPRAFDKRVKGLKQFAAENLRR